MEGFLELHDLELDNDKVSKRFQRWGLKLASSKVSCLRLKLNWSKLWAGDVGCLAVEVDEVDLICSKCDPSPDVDDLEEEILDASVYNENTCDNDKSLFDAFIERSLNGATMSIQKVCIQMSASIIVNMSQLRLRLESSYRETDNQYDHTVNLSVAIISLTDIYCSEQYEIRGIDVDYIQSEISDFVSISINALDLCPNDLNEWIEMTKVRKNTTSGDPSIPNFSIYVNCAHINMEIGSLTLVNCHFSHHQGRFSTSIMDGYLAYQDSFFVEFNSVIGCVLDGSVYIRQDCIRIYAEEKIQTQGKLPTNFQGQIRRLGKFAHSNGFGWNILIGAVRSDCFSISNLGISLHEHSLNAEGDDLSLNYHHWQMNIARLSYSSRLDEIYGSDYIEVIDRKEYVCDDYHHFEPRKDMNSNDALNWPFLHICDVIVECHSESTQTQSPQKPLFRPDFAEGLLPRLNLLVDGKISFDNQLVCLICSKMTMLFDGKAGFGRVWDASASLRDTFQFSAAHIDFSMDLLKAVIAVRAVEPVIKLSKYSFTERGSSQKTTVGARFFFTAYDAQLITLFAGEEIVMKIKEVRLSKCDDHAVNLTTFGSHLSVQSIEGSILTVDFAQLQNTKLCIGNASVFLSTFTQTRILELIRLFLDSIGDEKRVIPKIESIEKTLQVENDGYSPTVTEDCKVEDHFVSHIDCRSTDDLLDQLWIYDDSDLFFDLTGDIAPEMPTAVVLGHTSGDSVSIIDQSFVLFPTHLDFEASKPPFPWRDGYTDDIKFTLTDADFTVYLDDKCSLNFAGLCGQLNLNDSKIRFVSVLVECISGMDKYGNTWLRTNQGMNALQFALDILNENDQDEYQVTIRPAKFSVVLSTTIIESVIRLASNFETATKLYSGPELQRQAIYFGTRIFCHNI